MVKGSKHSPESRKKLSISHMGIKLGDKAKANLLFYGSGKNHWKWKGGISSNKNYRDWQKNQWHHRNRKASGQHSFEEWETLKAQYNWTCPACMKKEPKIKLTLDHIIPLSRGGSNNIENIQPLCKSCNCRKHTRNTKY